MLRGRSFWCLLFDAYVMFVSLQVVNESDHQAGRRQPSVLNFNTLFFLIVHTLKVYIWTTCWLFIDYLRIVRLFIFNGILFYVGIQAAFVLCACLRDRYVTYLVNLFYLSYTIEFKFISFRLSFWEALWWDDEAVNHPDPVGLIPASKYWVGDQISF